MDDDAELLRRYAEERSEAAFAEIVRRHLDLVYAVALRKVGRDAHLAQDVAQQVFMDVARKAPALARHPVLTGWLFTSTHYAATQLVRAEQRRRAREETAEIMNALLRSEETAPAIDWEQLRPVLDDLVRELSERDRAAVLLRYFEGRPLAEVGARLRISEEGARARVDRAVEKLRIALARRGVTSTAAALGLVLAEQVSAAAPVGLVSSVTKVALQGAAVMGGGAAAGVSLLQFMSMTKLSTAILVITLALSATANGYWLSRSTFSPAVEAAVPARTPIASPPAVEALATLAAGEPTVLRDRLRTAGVSERTARGIVEGILRRRYRETLSAQRAEQMRTAWWQDSSWWWQSAITQGPPRFVDDRKLLREMVLDPLDRLFGPDADDVAEQEAAFEFLPTEKRIAFAAMERNYATAMSRLAGSEQNSPAGSSVIRARDEKKAELLATLSPAERAEYDLHFSNTAVALHDRMNLLGATEAEYRAVMSVIPGSNGTERVFLTPAQEEQAGQQLVAALGYERALDYVWSGAREYPTYVQVAREAGLPADTAARVLELAAETTDRASAIHQDVTRSIADKRAALAALQAQVRPDLDALLPPAQQQRIGGDALTWFTALANGGYRFIPTGVAIGSGTVVMAGNASVATPLTGEFIRRQIVLRRPGGTGP